MIPNTLWWNCCFKKKKKNTLLSLPIQFRTEHWANWPGKLDAVTDSLRLVNECRVSGQFPDTEQLNAGGASSLCSSLSAALSPRSLHLPLICLDCLCLSIIAINGFSRLYIPWALQFPAVCLRSTHLSLCKASILTLPRSASLCSIQLSRLACLKSSLWRAVLSQVHTFG